jgi:hypothetical protein
MPEYEHSILGSCFLIKYRSLLWAVTAKHIIQNCGYTADKVRVPIGVEAADFIPFVGASTLDIPEGPDLADILVFRIDGNWATTNEQYLNNVYDLDAEQATTRRIDKPMAAHGFPNEMNAIDYCSNSSFRQGLIIEAENIQDSEMPGCPTIHLVTDAGLTDVRGFSGGPAFAYEDDGSGPTHLLGVLIRGNTNQMCFAKTAAIKSVIEQVLDDRT